MDPGRLLTLIPAGSEITWCPWGAQVQSFAFPFVKIYEIPVCPFLHPDKVPVKSNTTFWSTNQSSVNLLEVDCVSSCGSLTEQWWSQYHSVTYTPRTLLFLAPFLHGWTLSLYFPWITCPCFHLLYAFFPCLSFVKSYLFISADLLTPSFGFLHTGMDCSWAWRGWSWKINKMQLWVFGV